MSTDQEDIAPTGKGDQARPSAPTTGRESAGHLRFPDVPRLELDQVLTLLRDRADDVLSTQGRLRGLLRANAAVAADLSLPIVLRRIVGAARDLLSSHYAALSVVGPDGKLEQFVHTGRDDEIESLPCGRGILGLRVNDSAAIRLPDLSLHPDSDGFPPGHPPMAGFLGVPVQVGDDVFGNLYLTERIGGGPFTQEDEELARALAATAGVAIANARLFTESEQRRRWLAAAGELTHRLLSSSTEEPLELITQEAAVAAGADFATLTLPADKDNLVVAAVHGAQVSALLGRTILLNDSLAGRAIRTGKPLLIPDYRRENPALALDVDVGALIIVPLAAGEQVRGALTLGRLADRPSFTEADTSMAASFGSHAAVALELVEARADQLQLARLEDHDRIARDLHDHVIQEVFAVGIGLQGLASLIKKPVMADRITGYIDALDRVIAQIRTTIFQLHVGPKYGGLESRLLSIAHEHTPQLGFAPEVSFDGPLDELVTDLLADDILAVTREALSNCARHAQADSVDVVLSLRNNQVTLAITDNGRGIGTPRRSSGLANMSRRAEQHSGSVEFHSPDKGGTHLVWTALVCSRVAGPFRGS